MNRLFIISLALISGLVFVSCSSKEKIVSVNSVVLSESEVVLTTGEKQTLTAYISPSNATDKTVIWASSNASIATVSSYGEVTAVALGSASISASCDGIIGECVINVVACKAIDLGLSVKWADRNVGANSPVDYGDYFAWGETTPKSDYSWETYKWCSGVSDKLTKYNNDADLGIVDDKTALLPSDDAAHEKLGGTWRMPTWEEMEEMLEETDWSETTVNGVKGFLVTSLKNRKSIFLPSAGGIEGKNPRYQKTNIFYWTSEVVPYNTKQAFAYYTDEDGDPDFAMVPRNIGFPIRAVTK